MKGLILLALCPPLLACRAVTVIETPEGTVRAYDEKIAARGAELVQLQGPLVREALSTSGGPPPVALGIWRFRHAHPEAVAYTLESGIVIREIDGDWSFTLAHELVHWHATGWWETLPTVIEEALAHLLSYAVGGAPDLKFDTPTRQWIDAALSTSQDEFLSLPFGDNMSRLVVAGMWIVVTLGMEELGDLARQAQEQGLRKVPSPWILERLPATRSFRDFDPDSLFPGIEFPPDLHSAWHMVISEKGITEWRD
jgi:hypothetical protein